MLRPCDIDETWPRLVGKRHMEVDGPDPKRHKVWEDSALWGLCDALLLYANGPGHATSSCSQGWHFMTPGSPGGPLADKVSMPGTAGEPQAAIRAISEESTSMVHRTLVQPPSPLSSFAASSHLAAGTSGRDQGNAVSVPTLEPLLRALTQLANAAAAGASTRRQLVAECQVQAPLLRLMQTHWGQQPLVMERCCRLVHWLCARAPENRDMLAAHRSPCLRNCARSVTFVDALLGAVEAHECCRDVLLHALRALVAFLPCLHVREELLRAQQRLLSCLTLASEVLDAAAVRAVCRWLPGVSSHVRRARLRPSGDIDSDIDFLESQQSGSSWQCPQLGGAGHDLSPTLTSFGYSALGQGIDDHDVEMTEYG